MFILSSVESKNMLTFACLAVNFYNPKWWHLSYLSILKTFSLKTSVADPIKLFFFLFWFLMISLSVLLHAEKIVDNKMT
jgi:hypothetical protein